MLYEQITALDEISVKRTYKTSLITIEAGNHQKIATVKDTGLHVSVKFKSLIMVKIYQSKSNIIQTVKETCICKKHYRWVILTIYAD